MFLKYVYRIPSMAGVYSLQEMGANGGPSLKKYDHYVLPASTSSGGDVAYVVILTRDG
jgi:hypothetical protein